MKRFYLYVYLGFAAWLTLALSLHFLSASPWGGPLVLSPDRLLPDALFIGWGLLGLIALVFGAAERWIPTRRAKNAWRIAVLFCFIIYCIFGQVDREIMRWSGQHLTLPLLQNIARGGAFQMADPVFSQDIWWTTLSALVLLILPLPAIVAWKMGQKDKPALGWKSIAAATLFFSILVTSHTWFRYSPKRWHHYRPAVVSIGYDGIQQVLGRNRPKHPKRAFHDLMAIADGNADLKEVDNDSSPIPTYPFWHNDNLGSLSAEEFEALPLSQRPDIMFIVIETWRGWNTGLVPSDAIPVGNPQLNAIIKKDATYFPYTQSVGYPSVEGFVGLQLGVWAHPNKVFLTSYLSNHTLSFPEILRTFGYDSYFLEGTDPTFSNFEPWLRRLYNRYEYDDNVTDDGAMVDRFIERYKERRKDRPNLMTLWSVSTHPTYAVPGVPPADTVDGCYRQAIRYSDKSIARLIRFLKSQPDWKRTIVVLVGDHGQPTQKQRNELVKTLGPLTPGRTWTTLAILGGWPGLPAPGRYDFDVSQIDLAPTLLSILNIQSWNHFIGRDLRDVMRASKSSDPKARARAANAPVIALRHDYVAWQQNNERLLFKIHGDALFHVTFDRSDPLQYGQLRLDNLHIDHEVPTGWPVDRWKDAFRAYVQLLDEDRLMPPTAALPPRYMVRTGRWQHELFAWTRDLGVSMPPAADDNPAIFSATIKPTPANETPQ